MMTNIKEQKNLYLKIQNLRLIKRYSLLKSLKHILITSSLINISINRILKYSTNRFQKCLRLKMSLSLFNSTKN